MLKAVFTGFQNRPRLRGGFSHFAAMAASKGIAW
jgi:hypothetical protein